LRRRQPIASDQAQLAPLLDGIRANLGRNPGEVSADAGYCSAANLRTVERRRIAGYIATGRQKHGSKSATAKKRSALGSLIVRLKTRRLLEADTDCESRSSSRCRTDKTVRGFEQFLLRGIDKVKHEWALVCTAQPQQGREAA
jgi:hypothetical protein